MKVSLSYGILLKGTPKGFKKFFGILLRILAYAYLGTFLLGFLGRTTTGQNQSAANGSIAPHQFEETNRVAPRMNLAHLISVNGRNGN